MARRQSRVARPAVPTQFLLQTSSLPVPRCWFPDLSENVMAGIDEAGRGCLAGPVVAAAVILPAAADLPGLADSKTLSASRRDGLAAEIGAQALAWGLGVIWPWDIDRINILQATLKAMSRAVAALKVRPQVLLVDGKQTLPEDLLRAPLPRQKAVIDGDALVPVISAASILAKTFRDDLMDRLDRRYPVYGFARHKGYGTREHLEALRTHGPCRLHRLSFAKVLPEAGRGEAGQGVLRQGSLL